MLLLMHFPQVRAQLELANDRFKKRGLRFMLYPGLLSEFVRILFDYIYVTLENQFLLGALCFVAVMLICD